MISKFREWLFNKKEICIHTGIGYVQGNGVDINCEELTIFGIKFITKIRYNCEGEWLNKLKNKINETNKHNCHTSQRHRSQQ